MLSDIELMAIISNSMLKEMSDDPGTVVSWLCNNVNFCYEKGANINASLEQGTITSFFEENGTVKRVYYKNKNGKLLIAYSPLTIKCEDGFLNLRRLLCYPKLNVLFYFVGLILKNCKLLHANFGALILADPPLILFYPISCTEIHCLIIVPFVYDVEMTHYLKTLVASKVPFELYTAFISIIEKRNNKRTMMNRTMATAPHPTLGALLMGDAFNMRYFISGGELTVALSNIVFMRDLLRPLHNLYNAFAVCKYLESFYTLRKPITSTINILANILHLCLSLDEVFNAFKKLLGKDVILGIALLSGFDQNEVAHKSSEILRDILSSGILSDVVNCIDFHSFKVRLYNKKHYGIVIDIFGSTKELDKAMDITKRILIPAEPHVWNVLLGACKIHHNVEMGELAAKNLLCLDPNHA
ncbi:hypothetical protein CRYUN_Cryun01aG0072200 [Craigia yunnanensis]